MTDWQTQLRRLGVVKGARHLASPPPSPPATEPVAPVDAWTTWLPNGRVEENAVGRYYVVDSVHPITQRHGTLLLGDLLAFAPAVLAPYSDPRLTETRFDQLVFLDTETTGLAGAGTLAFMVGVGFFDGPAFVVQQYFLREPDEEFALLHTLRDLLEQRAGLVTFNGRTFDLPLLYNRYLMNRLLLNNENAAHLDLLLIARRLWRQRLGSVALATLEKHLLGVQRSAADVPGWRIPLLYHDYLRSGELGELVGVFYHNRFDVLSLVTLTAAVAALVEAPHTWPYGEDISSLARWQWQSGRRDQAETTYRLAVGADYASLAAWQQALLEWGNLLKSQERYSEAVQVWRQVEATVAETNAAHLELAKYYEWRVGDVTTALHWTLEALRRLPAGEKAEVIRLRRDWEHRRARLQRKLAGGATPKHLGDV